MPRNPEQNKQIRDERRDQILNASLVVFSRKGLAASKISDIVAAAGLSHGLVYHYFKSKDEIFSSVVEQTIELSKEANGKLDLIPGSPLEKIRRFTEQTLSVRTEEQVFRFLIMIQTYISDAVPPGVKEMAESCYEPIVTMASMIRKGQETGEIVNEDPDALATAYWALIQGLLLFKYNSSDMITIPDTNVILRLLKA